MLHWLILAFFLSLCVMMCKSDTAVEDCWNFTASLSDDQNNKDISTSAGKLFFPLVLIFWKSFLVPT